MVMMIYVYFYCTNIKTNSIWDPVRIYITIETAFFSRSLLYFVSGPNEPFFFITLQLAKIIRTYKNVRKTIHKWSTNLMCPIIFAFGLLFLMNLLCRYVFSLGSVQSTIHIYTQGFSASSGYKRQTRMHKKKFT